MLVRAITLLLIAVCATSHAADAIRLRTFPTERDVLPTQRARHLLQRAQIDFERLRRHQPPRYARLKYALYDGGTRVYQGKGYILTDMHKIAHFRHGRRFYERGPAIDLTMPITSRSLSYGEIRFAPDPR